MNDTSIDPEEAFKDAQLEELRAVLSRKSPGELRDILVDIVFVAHGSLLEEEHEGDSDTLGNFYAILQEHGLRPVGNFEISDDLKCTRCGAATDNGEGYDGLCGNCADREEGGE